MSRDEDRTRNIREGGGERHSALVADLVAVEAERLQPWNLREGSLTACRIDHTYLFG